MGNNDKYPQKCIDVSFQTHISTSFTEGNSSSATLMERSRQGVKLADPHAVHPSWPRGIKGRPPARTTGRRTHFLPFQLLHLKLSRMLRSVVVVLLCASATMAASIASREGKYDSHKICLLMCPDSCSARCVADVSHGRVCGGCGIGDAPPLTIKAFPELAGEDSVAADESGATNAPDEAGATDATAEPGVTDAPTDDASQEPSVDETAAPDAEDSSAQPEGETQAPVDGETAAPDAAEDSSAQPEGETQAPVDGAETAAPDAGEDSSAQPEGETQAPVEGETPVPDGEDSSAQPEGETQAPVDGSAAPETDETAAPDAEGTPATDEGEPSTEAAEGSTAASEGDSSSAAPDADAGDASQAPDASADASSAAPDASTPAEGEDEKPEEE